MNLEDDTNVIPFEKSTLLNSNTDAVNDPSNVWSVVSNTEIKDDVTAVPVPAGMFTLNVEPLPLVNIKLGLL